MSCLPYYPIELFLSQKEIAIRTLAKMLENKPHTSLVQDDNELRKSNTFLENKDRSGAKTHE